MEELTIGITLLKQAALYMKESGGNEIVKKAANDLYGWFSSKLSKNSQKKKLEALRENPENEATEAQVKGLLEDAAEDQDIDVSEVQQQAQTFEAVLKENDPVWYQQSTRINKTNTQTITGHGNIAAQDISGGSTININQGKKDE